MVTTLCKYFRGVGYWPTSSILCQNLTGVPAGQWTEVRTFCLSRFPRGVVETKIPNLGYIRTATSPRCKPGGLLQRGRSPPAGTVTFFSVQGLTMGTL